MPILRIIFTLCICLLLGACDNKPLNHPHGHKNNDNVFHTSFSEQPKTLDPAKSYNANETVFTAQIYEPPLQYHYLKRPYELIPLTAAKMPTVRYYDIKGNEVTKDSDYIAFSEYEISIKPGILFQPHPAFVKNEQGEFLYHNLSEMMMNGIEGLEDFQKNSTRELTAEDYVYQIKRLASPNLNSPIFGLMSHYIVGLNELNQKLREVNNEQLIPYLKNYPLAGAKVLDKYRYTIRLKGQYQQFIYWLAMPFFAPVPYEADLFYSQALLKDKNMSLSWYPVGTGPYLLAENNPNRQMVLKRNPNFRQAFYPGTTEKLPFIDEYHFTLEKESIPRWVKFLNGFYDLSSIGSDNFDEAVQISDEGTAQLTADLKDKNIQLKIQTAPAIYFFGFNMLDPVVGGNTQSARKLRQAISIALNFEEYVAIFLNGRGQVAQGPIPSGIFGYEASETGFNPKLYDKKNSSIQKKSLEEAKMLLKAAGYPNGRNIKTGEPLILHFDTAGAGPESKAMFAWLTKQFQKLGIQLEIRSTQYNRFQEKMRTGNAQMYMWGWLADYPDPENFLFLLYGPNSKTKYGGENASNYQNPNYDKLFNQMKNMPDGKKRAQIIKQMVDIIQRDLPWAGGFYPKEFLLSHQWVQHLVSNAVANNTLKYRKLDTASRDKLQKVWNKPVLWPLVVLIVLIVIIGIFVSMGYRKIQNKTQKEME